MLGALSQLVSAEQLSLRADQADGTVEQSLLVAREHDLWVGLAAAGAAGTGAGVGAAAAATTAHLIVETDEGARQVRLRARDRNGLAWTLLGGCRQGQASHEDSTSSHSCLACLPPCWISHSPNGQPPHKAWLSLSLRRASDQAALTIAGNRCNRATTLRSSARTSRGQQGLTQLTQGLQIAHTGDELHRAHTGTVDRAHQVNCTELIQALPPKKAAAGLGHDPRCIRQ